MKTGKMKIGILAIAIVFVTMIAVAAATSSVGFPESGWAVAASIAVVGIIAMTIGVVMWIAGKTKKSPTTWINSVRAIATTMCAMNARYPIYESVVKTSPRNLRQFNGSPRNY